MSTGDRELVGSFEESVGQNPDRADGEESVTGVMDAVKSLDGGDSGTSSTDRPYPETTKATARSLGLERIECPAAGCDYTNHSSQGIAAHVPNAQGDGHAWGAVRVSATDLHELASRGTHPDEAFRDLLRGDGSARRETDAAQAVKRVREWCRYNVPVDLEDLQVYVSPLRQRLEIALRCHLPEYEFTAYADAMADTELVYYDGNRGLNYVPDPDAVPTRGR